MRVLHVGKYYPPVPGGIETFLRDLATSQARHGIDVAAVVHGERSGSMVREGVQLFTAKSFGQLLYAPFSPAFPLVLRRALTQFRPDLLHVHLPNTSAFWLLTQHRAKQLPWLVQWQSDVVVDHSRPALRAMYGIYRHPERALLAKAARIVTASPDYLDASIPLKPWRDRARTIPLGVDPERLAVPPSAEAVPAWEEGEGLRLLAIGRLAHYKGHLDLLEALKQIEDAKLAIVGQGELGGQVRRRIAELGLERRVRLLGSLPQPAVNRLLRDCDVVCLASTARTEAFGVVLLEAMAAARPVVATNVKGSGMPWIVRTAGHGVLAEPGDAASLASAIERMRDAALRKSLGNRGAEALAGTFHIDHVSRAIASQYGETLGGTEDVSRS